MTLGGPAISAKFDIEADWALNHLCNYKCSYCDARADREHRWVGRISPEQYRAFFDNTGKTWMLHITGGEPFFHPQFVPLCETLSQRHYLSINSNLTSRRVYQFIEKIDPDRVDYVHCGVHYQERERRKGWRDLRAKIGALINRGFATFASLVTTPESFAAYPHIAEMFEQLDIPLVPKAIRGNNEGKFYPQAYTAEERRQFVLFSERAEKVGRNSRHRPFRNHPTVNPLLDRDYLDGVPDFTGWICSAGKTFVSIGLDGTIYRCGHKTVIGNIFRNQFRPYEQDQPCDDEWCPYFCLRYSQFRPSEAGDHRRRSSQLIPVDQLLAAVREARREVEYRLYGFQQRLGI